MANLECHRTRKLHSQLDHKNCNAVETTRTTPSSEGTQKFYGRYNSTVNNSYSSSLVLTAVESRQLKIDECLFT